MDRTLISRPTTVLLAAVGLAVLYAQAVLADTDLSSLLAAPPTSDWVERPPNPPYLIGPFTAHQYDVYVGDNGNSEDALGRYGFVAGYEREWVQKGTQDVLVERVFEFGASSGAGYLLSDLKVADHTAKTYRRDIPALAAATSYGVELAFTDGTYGYWISFVKGNLMYEVRLDSDTNDLTAASLAQAQAQYDFAPASVAVPSPAPVSPGSAANAGAAVFLAVVVLAGAIFFAINRRRRTAAVSTGLGGLQMSPDGNYWWDGQRWRPVATDPPPIQPR